MSLGSGIFSFEDKADGRAEGEGAPVGEGVEVLEGVGLNRAARRFLAASGT